MIPPIVECIQRQLRVACACVHGQVADIPLVMIAPEVSVSCFGCVAFPAILFVHRLECRGGEFIERITLRVEVPDVNLTAVPAAIVDRMAGLLCMVGSLRSGDGSIRLRSAAVTGRTAPRAGSPDTIPTATADRRAPREDA